jgi:formyltetrahydrofolate-dependent phosphoribosylglycinamide formyltransferase
MSLPIPTKLAVLISGGGSTMVNLEEQIRAGKLKAKIVQVIASTPKATGIQKAQNLGLPVELIARKQFGDSASFSERVWSTIRASGADLVCLAGFLSLLHIPDDFQGRVINIHPALLPKFGGHGMWGHHVHEAVLQAGEKESGCTVHYATNEYDTGPIILQRHCPVLPGDTPDTLAARVMAEERIAYPEAIRMLQRGTAPGI